MIDRAVRLLLAAGLASLAGCASEVAEGGGSAFEDGEAALDDAKFDTGYVTSLDAAEVELDIEAEVDFGDGYWNPKAALHIGQYALTYLRTHEPRVFIQ